MVNASQETYKYGPVSSGRVRKSSTIKSRSLAISDTCDFDKLLIPKEATRSFILRVDTPFKKQVAITVVSARSARVRRSSSQSGKKDPERNLCTATSMVPTRVSRSRWWYPLRTLVRDSDVVA